MTGRIEGWTQDDEDKTFGRNGYEREWQGDGTPTLEEQRVLKDIRNQLADQLGRPAPSWIPR